MASVVSGSSNVTNDRCTLSEVFCQQQREFLSQWQAKCRELEVKVQKEKEDVGEAWGKVAGLEQTVFHYENQVAKINAEILCLQLEKQSDQVENERLQSELRVALEKAEETVKLHADRAKGLEETVNASRKINLELGAKLTFEAKKVKQLEVNNFELHRAVEKLNLVEKANLEKIEDLNVNLKQKDEKDLQRTKTEQMLRQEICKLNETVESFKSKNAELSDNAQRFQTEIAKLQEKVKVEMQKVARFHETEKRLLEREAKLGQEVTSHLQQAKNFTEQITDLESAKQKLETQVEQQNREISQLKLNEENAKKVDKLEKCCQTDNTELANCNEHKAQIRDMVEINMKLMKEVEQLKECEKEQAGKILKLEKARQQRKEIMDKLEPQFQQQIKETLELKEMYNTQTEKLQTKITSLEIKLASEKEINTGMAREVDEETNARVEIEKLWEKLKAVVGEVNTKMEKQFEKIQPNMNSGKEMKNTRRSSGMNDPMNKYGQQYRLERNLERVEKLIEAELRKKSNARKSETLNGTDEAHQLLATGEAMDSSLDENAEEMSEKFPRSSPRVKRARKKQPE